MDPAARQRILVTGGSGFIGTNLVASYLAEAHVTITNLDLRPPQDVSHRHAWQRVDVLDRQQLRRAFSEISPDVVFHLAARTDLFGNGISGYAANVEGVHNIVSTVSATPSVRRVIFASSRMVCRIGYEPTSMDDYCPPNAYGLSKVLGERIVRSAATSAEWVLVRPTSIWGPWFAVPYRSFFDSVQRGYFFRVRGRDPHKSFGFVGNSVHQLRMLAEAPSSQVAGRTLYLGDYPPIRVNAMAESIQRASRGPKIRTVPYAALRGAALAGDLFQHLGWRDVPLTSFRLSNLLTDMTFDLTELQSIVGPLPYSMEDGVLQTVAWMRGEQRQKLARE